MRTLAMCGASCERRSFFYCTGAAWKSLRLLPLPMIEGYVGRSWVVWTGVMGQTELRNDGVLRSSLPTSNSHIRAKITHLRDVLGRRCLLELLHWTTQWG